ncbi:ankyrin 2,3/unc44 [Reticulomyxa filosa]|uniref:Ankyrin 2,3/unc44 n=1 Tax=Reticulomyxa filosa TaxID=46433 RepID=X6N0Z3_RETFI|nr:ankyrin 2,3/unc44 [Reticulomyxa filosa]|eukprot:ETO19369.1 ankyrin 2,3/unc44 [Reticulomyxa filosa]
MKQKWERGLLYFGGCLLCFFFAGTLKCFNCLKQPWNISYMFYTARFIENSFWLILIGVLAYFDMNCYYICSDYSFRHNLVWKKGIVFYFLAVVAVVLTIVLYAILFNSKLIMEERTVARGGEPVDLIDLQRYDDLRRLLAGDTAITSRPVVTDKLEKNVVIDACVHAAVKGDLKALKVFGELYYNFDLPDRFGWTPLIYCAREGHSHCVELLCKYGTHVDFADKDGKTAASHAAEFGKVEMLRTLGNMKANLAHVDHAKNSVAGYAFQNGHMSCIAILAEFHVCLFIHLFFVEWEMPQDKGKSDGIDAMRSNLPDTFVTQPVLADNAQDINTENLFGVVKNSSKPNAHEPQSSEAHPHGIMLEMEESEKRPPQQAPSTIPNSFGSYL